MLAAEWDVLSRLVKGRVDCVGDVPRSEADVERDNVGIFGSCSFRLEEDRGTLLALLRDSSSGDGMDLSWSFDGH